MRLIKVLSTVSCFLVLLMGSLFVFFVSAETYSGKCGENLVWELESNTGILNISGTGEMDCYYCDEILYPWHPYRDKIKHVRITDGVTTIGSSAFYRCYFLNSVEMPGSIKKIKNSAFSRCSSLTSINIPEGTEIVERAFQSCENLHSVSFPSSVTHVHSQVFLGTPIKNIYISDLTSWCTTVYHDGSGMFVDVDEVNLLINEELVSNVTIPNSVTRIIGYAFWGFGIKSVIIPESITKIERGVFYNCTKLQYVILPSSVTTIEDVAFKNCKNLTDVYYCGSEDQWNKIVIKGGNDSLNNATIHFICTQIDTSIIEAYTNKNAIIVSENQKTSAFKDDDYKMSSGATVIHSENTYTTDENGIAIVEKLENGGITD